MISKPTSKTFVLEDLLSGIKKTNCTNESVYWFTGAAFNAAIEFVQNIPAAVFGTPINASSNDSVLAAAGAYLMLNVQCMQIRVDTPLVTSRVSAVMDSTATWIVQVWKLSAPEYTTTGRV